MAQWLETTLTLIGKVRCDKYQMFDALERDCKVQLWLARAQQFLKGEADVTSAGSCFEQAEQLGWKMNQEAKEVVDEQKTLHRIQRSAEELIADCAFCKPLNDPPLRGINPLEFAVARADLPSS